LVKDDKSSKAVIQKQQVRAAVIACSLLLTALLQCEDDIIYPVITAIRVVAVITIVRKRQENKKVKKKDGHLHAQV
jgi:hypothetical protein